MLHPDYQYDATRIPALIAPIAAGERDLMLGSRFLGDPLAGGMPRWKYVSNRVPDRSSRTCAFGLHLSEYHTGLRAYSRHLLETIPYDAQQRRLRLRPGADRPGRGGRDAPAASARSRVPTRYFEEAISVGFRRSVVYGLSTLRVVAALPAPPARASAARRS